LAESTARVLREIKDVMGLDIPHQSYLQLLADEDSGTVVSHPKFGDVAESATRIGSYEESGCDKSKWLDSKSIDIIAYAINQRSREQG
jgi:hypothetical protein